MQEFVRMLLLHRDYPAHLFEQAVEQAISYGCMHLDGVLHCLRQLTEIKEEPTRLDLSDRPDEENVGNYQRKISYRQRTGTF